MPRGKAALKELVDAHFHREGLAPADLEVVVADRAELSGDRRLPGEEIMGASGGFIELRDGARVPFHKVRAVRSKGKLVYERRARG